ncbi:MULTISPECIES: hypothetical protein [Lysinibacillus]|nr:hypothetical protein [Lysinibacillus sphaericus]
MLNIIAIIGFITVVIWQRVTKEKRQEIAFQRKHAKEQALT